MTHFERLLAIYEAAPIHSFYEGLQMALSSKKCEISLPLKRTYFHAGMAAHGSVYFKLLDDAAYFACQTEIEDYFIVTTNFNINLLRPLTKGIIKAVGEVDFMSLNLFTASARLYDEKGRLCATGQGQFMKSKIHLTRLIAD
jgi:uncharacterized protein (TIGR00369 family)